MDGLASYPSNLSLLPSFVDPMSPSQVSFANHLHILVLTF
jgi:hypothetical protein